MTDLMPCPVCGSDSCNVPDSYEGTVNCHGPTCCYGVWTVEEHNTLARRAEIGRLVEQIVALDRPVMLSPPHKSEPNLYRTSSTVWCITKGLTILDALRSLEKEVCGDT